MPFKTTRHQSLTPFLSSSFCLPPFLPKIQGGSFGSPESKPQNIGRTQNSTQNSQKNTNAAICCNSR